MEAELTKVSRVHIIIVDAIPEMCIMFHLLLCVLFDVEESLQLYFGIHVNDVLVEEFMTL